MCDDEACDSALAPPVGENWCIRRLNIEWWRWVSEYKNMHAGEPLDIQDMLDSWIGTGRIDT